MEGSPSEPQWAGGLHSVNEDPPHGAEAELERIGCSPLVVESSPSMP